MLFGQSTPTVCPDGLWSLLIRRSSKPAWMQSSAACSRGTCFARGVAVDDDYQRSLPTPATLSFCKKKQMFFGRKGPSHFSSALGLLSWTIFQWRMAACFLNKLLVLKP